MFKTYKGLMIILDGLGDRGIPAFGGKTPLEVADTPNMDRLAQAGQCGLVDPLLPGLPVGTHTGIALLFGLTRKQTLKLARGPVEACGVGLTSDRDALYFRCNFATLEKSDGDYRIIDRRAGRIDHGTELLAAAIGRIDLGDGIVASLHPATQHRVVLQLQGKGLSAKIRNTDPGNHYHTLGLLPCLPDDPHNRKAARTAAAINRLIDQVYERLDGHEINRQRREQGLPPANGILCRSPGRLPKIKPLLQYLKLKAAVVSGERTVLGLGKLMGYSVYDNPAFRADKSTDLSTKIKVTEQALAEHDLVFLHIKATDLFSHDLDPAGKREMLMRIDDAIAPLINDDRVIAITADHSTDSNTGRHTGDPVPSLIYNPYGRVDRCESYSEQSCVSGGLGRIGSRELLLTLLDQMNSLENYRSRDRNFMF
ncbi:MAG: 2,3-bisphosphoglycerate-independent phosphoglycerate mutase [Candidatus Thiodiazotropha sp.]